MNPALEYLIHSGLIKEWFSLPCSLFLQKKGTMEKLVVTISSEFFSNEKYSIKHWNIAECNNQQALPSMFEYSISKKEINRHPAVIVPGCRLINYEQESIATSHNSFRTPMSTELYEYFFENTLNNVRYEEKRLNWLWSKFIRIYIPNLAAATYIPMSYRTEAEISEEQRRIVNQSLKKEWLYWEKWKQHMLLRSAELVFYKEYQ